MIFSIELLIQKGANVNEWCPDECALFVAENNCDAKLEKYSLLTMLISISKQPSVVTLLYSGLLLPIKKCLCVFKRSQSDALQEKAFVVVVDVLHTHIL